jgi:hypothetical protein
MLPPARYTRRFAHAMTVLVAMQALRRRMELPARAAGGVP